MKPGGTAARGYGGKHQQLRASYKQRMANGERFTCWRCGLEVDPATPWDLGRDDLDRSIYRGPEHRGRECPQRGNRATSGRRNTIRVHRWKL